MSTQELVTRREYFIYKGVKYGIGTKVLLSDVGCKRHYISQKHKDMPHTFGFGDTNGVSSFNWRHPNGGRYGLSNATILDCYLDEDIKEIVEPVYVEFISWQKKAINNMMDGKIHPDIFGGAVLYILVMVVGALFYARLTIWVIATITFIIWLLNQYRT